MFYNHVLLILLCLFCAATASAQNKNMITGDKKLFDRIIRHMENNLEKNYFVDSLQPVQYSEYTFVASSKHLLNAVYIEGVPRPVWFFDFSYYKKKYGMDALLPLHYWVAKLYEEMPGERYGNISFGDTFGYMLFGVEAQSTLAQHVTVNAQRRKEKEAKMTADFNRTQLGNPSYTMDNRISSSGDAWENFQVSDTLYENQPCYKLIRTYKGSSIYGTKEAKRFEERYPVDNEYNKELHRLVNLWGNAVYSGKVERIIGKADYAMLHLHSEHFIENAAGKFLTNWINDRFEKAGKHYRQISYSACTRRLVTGTVYINDEGIYTYRIKRPLYDAPPIDSAQTYQYKIAQPPAGYEGFCTRVDAPDKEMLEEWLRFITQKANSENLKPTEQ